MTVFWLVKRVRSALSLSYSTPSDQRDGECASVEPRRDFGLVHHVVMVPLQLGRSRSTKTAFSGVPSTGKSGLKSGTGARLAAGSARTSGAPAKKPASRRW